MTDIRNREDTMNKFIKKVDPSTQPDGLCWKVVQQYPGREPSKRTRFVNQEEAEEYAREVVGKDGCVVHLEGPLRT